MSLFKKKKGNVQENGYAGKPKDYFREAVENRKVKVANWLQEKTERYSPFQKKTAFIVFCIFIGTASFFILAGSIRSHNFGNRDLIIDHLHSGAHQSPAQRVSDSVFRKAERTKLWLDSIRRTDSNRFQVILLSNPFLLDNLQLIERIYQSQTR